MSNKSKQIDKIFAIVSTLIPDNVLMLVSEWAEKNRYLDSKASGRSGLFEFECSEIYASVNALDLKEIMKGTDNCPLNSSSRP